ncbi:FMR1 neighbor protein isoform X2 [Petaurus breviceps papuanus]|uniref:FMR1 neighbor protein isoform X2 n=1 Tax=Petaurus breviceps papuanus TaxID=3040969 RepID=UPI0036DCE5C8
MGLVFHVVGSCALWMLCFGFRSACWPRDGQKIEACRGNEILNQTMCLKFGCCYFPEENNKITCYSPLVNNIQLSLRLFFIGIVCLSVLGDVLICCCIICQQSKLTNNLPRGNSEVTKTLLDHDDTLENIDDVNESFIQEDEKRKMREEKKNKRET